MYIIFSGKGAGPNYEVLYEFFSMKYFSKFDLQDLFQWTFFKHFQWVIFLNLGWNIGNMKTTEERTSSIS